MIRLWVKVLSVALLVLVLITEITLFATVPDPLRFEYNSILGLMGTTLALLFVGIQLYAIADSMSSRQSL